MSQKHSSTIPLLVLIAGIIDIVLGAAFIIDPDLYTQNLGGELGDDIIILLGYFSIGIGSFLIFASMLIFAATYRTGGVFALIGGIISLLFINIISGILGSLGGWWTLKKVKKAIGATCLKCGLINPIAAPLCYSCGAPLLIPKENSRSSSRPRSPSLGPSVLFWMAHCPLCSLQR